MTGVLITGGAKRIGAHIAKALAVEGRHVVVHYHTGETEARRLAREVIDSGGRISLIQADLADSGSYDYIMDRAVAECPTLHALINNAAVFEYDDIHSVTPARLQHNFSVNAVAPIMLVNSFLRALPQDQEGCIINMLDNRVFAINPDYFSYAVSKHALLGATLMLASALAPRIRVLGIAPGITLVSGKQSERNFQIGHSLNPLRQGCTMDQISRSVQFILSTKSLNAQVITIDGGETLCPPGRDVAFLSSE